MMDMTQNSEEQMAAVLGRMRKLKLSDMPLRDADLTIEQAFGLYEDKSPGGSVKWPRA